jgi:hypothetical protein
LFEGVDAGWVALEHIRAETTQRVSHLTYAIRGGNGARQHNDSEARSE